MTSGAWTTIGEQVEKHFSWERDMALDLARLRDRLIRETPVAAVEPAPHAAPQLSPDPAPAPAPPPRAAWRRLLTYVKSLLLLTRTRHQTRLLADEMRQVRALAEETLARLDDEQRQRQFQAEAIDDIRRALAELSRAPPARRSR